MVTLSPLLTVRQVGEPAEGGPLHAGRVREEVRGHRPQAAREGGRDGEERGEVVEHSQLGEGGE